LQGILGPRGVKGPPLTLAEIAAARGESLQDLTARIMAAVAIFRATHP